MKLVSVTCGLPVQAGISVVSLLRIEMKDMKIQ